MMEIADTGKVWIKGKSSPEYAVRVDDKVFVPGREEDEEIECWVAEDCLYADLHHRVREKRTIRRFDLGLNAGHPATLFNGFTKTQHGDVRVVTHRDAGVEQLQVQGEKYRSSSIGLLDSRGFAQWAAERPEWIKNH